MHYLRELNDEVMDAIVDGLLHYHVLPTQSKVHYQVDRVQYSRALHNDNWNPKQGMQKNYLLPISIPATLSDSVELDGLREAFRYRICLHAWCNIHNIGWRRHKTMSNIFEKMEMPKQKNVGNMNRRKPLMESISSIRKKLTWAQDNLACPFATKLVRDVAGLVTLRNNGADDEDDLVFLPPNTTMRGMWLDWVRERGWDPVQTCKNRRIYKSKRDWVLAPNCYETADEVEGAEPITLPDGSTLEPRIAKQAVIFETFRKLWKKEFPHLRIRGRGEDTCTDCFKIKNKLRHLLRKKMIAELKVAAIKENAPTPTENTSEDEPTESPDEAALRMTTDLKEFFEGDCPETEKEHTDTDIYEEVSPDDLVELIEEINAEVELATTHVKMHIAQREEAKKEIEEGKLDYKNKLPIKQSTFPLTMDMSQNGAIPSLSGDQCGDFYYMSPYIQYIFGICNNSTRKMDVFVWGEKTAKRGADNIVS